jgi:hypothetical protein
MTCHNTPSITNRITMWYTPANITWSGVQSTDAPCCSPALTSGLKRLFRASALNPMPRFWNWKFCPNTCTSWWKSIPSTAFTGWCVPSKDVPHGFYGRNIPGSSPACRPSGRTPILSPRLVVLHSKWLSNTSKTRNEYSMIQRQLKLRLNTSQAQQLDTWLWHLTGVWNWAIRKIEADAKDGISYSQQAFHNVLADHGKKLGIPSHTLGYPFNAGQLGYDWRYSKTPGMPVTGGHDFRALKPLWHLVSRLKWIPIPCKACWIPRISLGNGVTRNWRRNRSSKDGATD